MGSDANQQFRRLDLVALGRGESNALRVRVTTVPTYLPAKSPRVYHTTGEPHGFV